MPETAGHRTVFLKDYHPPDYRIHTANLQFELDEDRTIVKSLLIFTAEYDRKSGIRPLALNGRDLELLSVTLNGVPLGPGEYQADHESLTIAAPPDSFTLEIETAISPGKNTELSGLYTSGGNFCTQCEAEGFRKITYYLDRPDVMARFFTSIVADREKYPVLLSNGNLIDSGSLPDGRHYAKWHDPFPKPSYLFALVAGDLSRIEDTFITRSGKGVNLHIYVQRHNMDKCSHAMDSLKLAMKWDEDVYGREYDLEVYMIVAVDDFNMGAMENKGLNIFNSKYVLASPETATDADFIGITGVVGHEYFHNWSGNRVTCRDWFQLSLKEGFTLFRDQQFTSDMSLHAVKRINDANIIRTYQFREDSGPMAHPIRPESYVEINNFYTLTVYNKGAEVIRMLLTLLGPEGFRKGTDLYFERHDGQAVTTEDFIKAMEDETGADLRQFRRWYFQAGTPELTVTTRYDAAKKIFSMTVRQTCKPTPGQLKKDPFHIPLSISLLDKSGKDLPLRLEGGTADASCTGVLEIKQEEETFTFLDISEKPIPSLLRGFSAPVKLRMDRSDEEIAFLMAHDSDEFNRWDAGQQMAIKALRPLIGEPQSQRQQELSPAFTAAFGETLLNSGLEHGFKAFALTLPSEMYLSEFMTVIDPDAVHSARRLAVNALAARFKDHLMRLYDSLADARHDLDQTAIGRRSLRNVCLGYLAELNTADSRRLCLDQFIKGNNMTDIIAAMTNLANIDCPERKEALDAFYEKWRHDQLVMDKWLTIRASSRLPDTLSDVKALMNQPVFNIRNPNKVRALIGAFGANAVRFHDRSGEGYRFFADQVLEIDRINPQIAARLANAFSQWRRYGASRRELMKSQLERIRSRDNLSKDVHEVASKSLTE